MARLLVVVALTAGYLTGPAVGATAAQDGVTLSVTGAPEGELVLVPGGDTSTRITVANPADRPQDVEVEVTGLRVADGEFRFDGSPAEGLTVTVNPGRFTLPPKGRRDVAVVLSAARTINPGAAYAGLVVRGLPDAGTGESPVVGEVALPLLGRVPGAVTDTGRIVTFGPERPEVPQGQVRFAVEFEATGDVHLTPVGTVEVFAGDRSLGLVDVEKLAVLPGTTRRLGATWTGETPVGTLRAHLDLRWGLNGQFHETRDATVDVVPASASGGGRSDGDGGGTSTLFVVLLVIGLSLLAILLLLAAVLLAREQLRKRSP